MAVHDSLKSLVRQYIKTNGQNEITGQILQNVLIAMIDELGITIDPTPTKNSSDAVSSGGTFGALQQLNEINATLSGDGKIYNNYQAGDIYYTEQNSVRVYWVALADGEASEENPVTISDLNFYHAENATDAVRMSLSTKTFNIDAYTKQESDAKYQPKGNYQPAGDYATEQQLAGKANASDVYTKSETYSKAELDNLITTPNQQYVSVTATAQTTAITDLLPATGAADTIYRVGNWDGTQYDPTMYALFAWNGTTYVCLAVRSFVGEVYDVSVNHPDGQGNPTPYADLTTALGTSGANIPADIRRGGMSIKFIQGNVQSSDNKYVQYRLMDTAWSINTENWAIADEGVYVENPEFVYVKTDANNKILWAIKIDGSIYYGAGVPQQVIDYIEEKIANLSLDEYEDIVAFLNDLEKGDKTLQDLLNEKVDKEEGKSLIDADYASTKSTVNNPEFLEVTTDSEDKVLEGIQKDGTKVIGGNINVGGYANISGDIRVLGNMELSGVSYKVVKSPEYIAAWLDAEDKVIFGFKNDGKTYVGEADFLNDIKNNQEAISEINATIASISSTIEPLDINALTSVTATENPEFIEAKTDSEGKLLAGRTTDGAAFEKVGFSTPKVSIDVHTIENIEDPEGRSEITTDSDGRIVSYRDINGVKHENVGIETSNLNFTGTGLSDLAKDLKEVGIGVTNWSDKKELHIEEPYCAMVNFSGIDNIPQVKYSDDNRPHAYMQFWDMNGNYFKKEVLINAQGRSTMAHPKKNIAIDICNNNGWDDGDTFSLQIGDWIPQDSFHLKAFYNDPFRCLSPVAYKLNDEILKTRGEHNDYVWKKALLDLDDITPTSTGCETAEDAIDGWNTNARCFPMGFPCIVYLNGEFYGIYSWQLKKHRDNYMMSKKKTKHIHLDGIISLDRILNANGDTTKIWWTTNSPEGVEIRNPKPKKKKDGWDLVLLNGEKYDADANGGEIMSPTMVVEGAEVANPNWNPDDASHVKSYEVKQYILNMSKIIPTLADAYNTYEESAKTSEDKTAFKEVFEAYFDVDNLIDYLILSDVLANYDGFSQNVQWITYNGVKWYLCAYDMDGVMGNWWELNNTIVAPRSAHYDYAQFQYLPIFYNNELETRYKELRDKNIISVENISGLVEYWLKRIGAKETFDKEWEKWSGFIKNDNVHRLYKWLQVSILNMDTLYNYNQN